VEFINATRMQAGYTLGVDPSGREALVVVIKGTFVLPRPGEPAQLHEEQMPLVMADTFSGDPGFSAPVYEVDFALRKNACDVLLVGSACAAEGRPVTRTSVGLRVGTMTKSFDVIGDRVWQAAVTGIRASEPQPFVRMPISYDVAFGGADRESEDPAEHDAFLPNPVGRGYRKHLRNAWVDGRPLPNTEEAGQPVRWPADRYRPMAFGPVGRGWVGRREYAGTYDQQWVDEGFPFLPADFDERYFQAAPPDQQLPLPQQPLEVVLDKLTMDGQRRFTLPHFEAPVYVFPRRAPRVETAAKLDTIVFEPDQERFTMVWRMTHPLKKNMFELAQVMVGRKGRAWWQRRDEMAFPIPVVMVPPSAPEATSQ
jgi:hypothetical protein